MYDECLNFLHRWLSWEFKKRDARRISFDYLLGFYFLINYSVFLATSRIAEIYQTINAFSGWSSVFPGMWLLLFSRGS